MIIVNYKEFKEVINELEKHTKNSKFAILVNIDSQTKVMRFTGISAGKNSIMLTRFVGYISNQDERLDFTITTRAISKFLRTASSDELKISFDAEHIIVIQCGKYAIKVDRGLAHDNEVLNQYEHSGENVIKSESIRLSAVDAELLTYHMKRVSVAVGDGTATTADIMLAIKDGEATIATTDNCMIVQKVADNLYSLKGVDEDIVISTKHADIIYKAMLDGDVIITWEESHYRGCSRVIIRSKNMIVSFARNDDIIIPRFISRIQKVLDTQSIPDKLRFSTREVRDAIRVITLGDKNQGIVFKPNRKTGVLTLTAIESQISATIVCESSSDNTNITLNGRYVDDFLSVADVEMVLEIYLQEKIVKLITEDKLTFALAMMLYREADDNDE